MAIDLPSKQINRSCQNCDMDGHLYKHICTGGESEASNKTASLGLQNNFNAKY